MFLLQLFRSVSEQALSFSGKADQHLVPFLPTQFGENIRIFLQFNDQLIAGLLDLLLCTSEWTIICHRGRLDDNICGRKMLQNRGTHFLSAADRHAGHALWNAEAGRTAHQDHRSATRPGGRGDSVAHLA